MGRITRYDDRWLASLKPKAGKRVNVPDPNLKHHYIRITPDGTKTSYAVALNPWRKQVWAKVGTFDLRFTLDRARKEAVPVIERIKTGKPVVELLPPKPESFKAVAQQWIKQYVEEKKLRSRDEMVRQLEVYVYPYWGDREFTSIRRSDVVLLLDGVVDKTRRLRKRDGKRMADMVLSLVSGICRWYQSRSNDYVSPVVPGMKRSTATGGRERTLSDLEIVRLWAACEENRGAFAGMLQFALLTGQRKAKYLDLKWDDITDHGVGKGGTWVIRTAPREKHNAGALALPEMAMEIIRRQPRWASLDRVFASTVGVRLSSSGGMRRINEKLPGMAAWTVHDLRRSAKTLMRRAGVSRDDSEAVLGHRPGGVEGIYDRYHMFNEKKAALQKLAALVGGIIDGTVSDNIVPLRRERSGLAFPETAG